MMTNAQRDLGLMLAGMRHEKEVVGRQLDRSIVELRVASLEPCDRADVAQSKLMVGVAVSLADANHREASNISDAMKSVKRGVYGICECGATIGVARLEALPYARRCLDCQTAHERNQ